MNLPKMVTVTINKSQYRAEEGETLLLVAIRNTIDIPHLCYEESLDPYGACRLCMVDLVTCGKRTMMTACTLRAKEGLEIMTDTPEIIRYRKTLLELYLSEAPKSDVIKTMAARYGVKKTPFLKKIVHDDPLGGKCILCGICVRVCDEIMGASAINFINRGPSTVVNTPFFEENPDCLGCGTCAKVCPTRAIEIEDQGDLRIMRSWSGTRIQFQQCTECGGYFAPKVMLEKTLAHLDPGLAKELKYLCPTCRSKSIVLNEIRAMTGGFTRNART
ncbi:MAG: ferredoxin [Methanomicrobiales archaeon HGW-Methanomicrobiales-4]|nr:MAG: ferredoxin [Methanomicrobiales archaeon HGW-Methanomicrobiales-4]